MITIIQPAGITDKNVFAAGLHYINPAAVRAITMDRVEPTTKRKILRCDWDDSLAPAPNEQQIIDAYAARSAAQDGQQTRRNDAITTLINNADLIKSAMQGIPEARAALDVAIPIDTTNQATLVDTLARRQAAVLFLAANALRAVSALDHYGDLPDSFTDTFL